MKLKKKSRLHSSDQRLYQLSVPVIGLTGGIATGKTTVAKMLEAQGLPVINADHLVKDVYALPETIQYIEKKHPDVMQDGAVQFPMLRQKVFNDVKVKLEIENLIYKNLPQAFTDTYRKLESPQVVVYDVPLLFEKHMEAFFDTTVVVYAPKKVQLARLVNRDGHSEALALKILDQQMDIEDKKLQADFIIDNSKTEAELAEEVKSFLRQIFEA